MKTKLHVLALLMLCAIGSGCGAPETAGVPSESDPPPAKIRAATARIDTLQPVLESVGTLVPIPESTAVLSSQVSGQVAAVGVEEGQTVEAEAEIVRLDTRLAEAELAKALAARDQAQANLALLERGPLPQELAAARDDARNAEATAQSAQHKLDALEPLHRNGEISNVQYEQAKSALEGARALAAAAEAKRKLVEAGTRPEALAEARAQVASAEAGAQAQALAVALSRIASPIHGVVTELPVRKGMFVQPGATLATIVDMSSLFVRFRIPTEHLNDVRDGAPVTITTMSNPTRAYTGSVSRIGRSADTSTGDVMGYATIRNPDLELRPNLGCSVRIELPAIPNALVVPVAAIADRDGASVVTVVRDGLAYETVVTLGGRANDFAQVVSGVAAGDTVATEGGYGLPDGCPVRVVDEAADTTR